MPNRQFLHFEKLKDSKFNVLLIQPLFEVASVCNTCINTMLKNSSALVRIFYPPLRCHMLVLPVRQGPLLLDSFKILSGGQSHFVRSHFL